MFWSSKAIDSFKDIKAGLHLSENEMIEKLLHELHLTDIERSDIIQHAKNLVSYVREYQSKNKGMESFLAEYGLSNQEGIMLMCLAEALLRVPDKQTADKLIKDKLTVGDWEQHLGKSESLMVNASSWALMLTDSILVGTEDDNVSTMRRLISRTGEPVIRAAIVKAMQFLGKQFVIGETIGSAIKNAKRIQSSLKSTTCFSFDMLGEAAMNAKDAEKYFLAYQNAIHAISKTKNSQDSISVKLSALHPRYELWKYERVHEELYEKLKSLAMLAASYNIPLTIDAEEARRLEISLGLIERLLLDPDLKGWHGLGLALQAYQKRAFFVIDWLADIARIANKKIHLRLVKGAYWDTEIKLAQLEGLPFFPVFTRKSNTDLSYLACAQKMIENADYFNCQFATHNAHTVAAIMQMQKNHNNVTLEFQRLYGMGEGLYVNFEKEFGVDVPCRIYAPVGGHKDLLAYLVRRLLENGANTSFVQHVANKTIDIDDIVQDPLTFVESRPSNAHQHPAITLPVELYGKPKNAHDYLVRKNAEGVCFYDEGDLDELRYKPHFQQDKHVACSLIDGQDIQTKLKENSLNPSTKASLGDVYYADEKTIEKAFKIADDYQDIWDSEKSLALKSSYLLKLSNELENNMSFWVSLLIEEAGKTYLDAVSEVREAIDFCRYYTQQANQLSKDIDLPGPTGESNQLFLRGKGTFVCISPWNFPLAIFLGQLSAAFIMGNTVIVKPAEQTSFIAYHLVKALHQIMRNKNPKDVKAVQLILGDGKVGSQLIKHEKTAGVAFTGSFEVAKIIQRELAEKEGPVKPLIAETGGINAMMVDSSALPEQVVRDVLSSGFQSAGQRCSALRLLLLQEDIADTVIEMLSGAMAELQLANPIQFSTDIGPVIDQEAYDRLEQYCLQNTKNTLYRTGMKDNKSSGFFIPPTLIEVKSISDLKEEMFGPIVHVYRFKAKDIEKTLNEVNQLGFGLTFGLHSRIQSTANLILKHVKVGNIYINRNMIGAIVGSQPFGGEGFSGTGPKAGGPHYLPKFANERAVSIDTTAAGGNASLLSLSEDD